MKKVKVALSPAHVGAPPARSRDLAPGLTRGHLLPIPSGLAALVAGVRVSPGDAR